MSFLIFLEHGAERTPVQTLLPISIPASVLSIIVGHIVIFPERVGPLCLLPS